MCVTIYATYFYLEWVMGYGLIICGLGQISNFLTVLVWS